MPAADPRVRRARAGLVLLAGLCLGAAVAAVEPRQFASATDEARYRVLLGELRCLVCQNQSLADSDAELAGDLRRQVYEMVTRGDSNQAIIDYLVSRYGDFVRYRPPVAARTLALWGGPFVLAVAGLGWMLRRIAVARRGAAPLAALDAQERARLDALLGPPPRDPT